MILITNTSYFLWEISYKMVILSFWKFISLSSLFCFLFVVFRQNKHFASYSDYRYVDSLYLKTFFFFQSNEIRNICNQDAFDVEKNVNPISVCRVFLETDI